MIYSKEQIESAKILLESFIEHIGKEATASLIKTQSLKYRDLFIYIYNKEYINKYI